MIRRAACAPSDFKNNVLLALSMSTAVILLGCGGGGGGGGGGGTPPGSGACGGAQMCGQVIADDSGTKVAGATVNLTDNAGNIVGTTSTDSNGFYKFQTVPAGALLITAVPPGATYFQNELRFNGNVYNLSGQNTARNGPCLPAIGVLANAIDNQLADIRVFSTTSPPPPPFGCPR